jgi:hypothetical protein
MLAFPTFRETYNSNIVSWLNMTSLTWIMTWGPFFWKLRCEGQEKYYLHTTYIYINIVLTHQYMGYTKVISKCIFSKVWSKRTYLIRRTRTVWAHEQDHEHSSDMYQQQAKRSCVAIFCAILAAFPKCKTKIMCSSQNMQPDLQTF